MIKDLIFSIIVSIILLIMIYYFGAFHIKQLIKYGKPRIDDYKHLDNDTIKADNPIAWSLAKDYNKFNIENSLRTEIESYEPVAFLVFQNGKIKYEEYWQGYDKDSIVNSFSMAKSIVSILVGIAIDEKYIKDVNQKVTDFLSDFNKGKPTELTIKDLLTMSSGIKWNENFDSPFSDVAQAYYGNNLQKQIDKIKVTDKIGERYNYQCINTQLLVQILQKATKTKISKYLYRNLWYPIGAEHDALWSMDNKNGQVRGFCCFNSTARDFARLGHVLLNKGEFNDQFIVPRSYLSEATKPADYLVNSHNKKVDYYGYHFSILNYNGKQIPYFNGMKGQYIFVLEDRNAVVVRLGNLRSKEKINNTPKDVFLYLDVASKILD